MKVPEYECYNDSIVLVGFLSRQIYVGEDLKVKIKLYYIGTIINFINFICYKIWYPNKTLQTSSNDEY